MPNQSRVNDPEKNKSITKKKKMNNEVKNTENKKLKLKAENKSTNHLKLEKKEKAPTVHASSTVQLESSESSNNMITKKPRSSSSNSKIPKLALKVPQSDFDQQLQCNIPSLPENLLSLPGCSNNTQPNQLDSIPMAYPYILQISHEQCSEIIDFSDYMYNEDVVTEEKQFECVICLENINRGHIIARLQCFCIFHKFCIDLWFKKNVWCPCHPPS